MRSPFAYVPAVILFIGAAFVVHTRSQSAIPLAAPLATVLDTVSGYRSKDQVISDEERRVAGMSNYVARVYSVDSAVAFTTLVSYYERQTQGKTIHSPRNCLPGAGWEILTGGTKSVVRLDPKTRKIRTYPIGMYAHDIVLDSKGSAWFNDYFSKPERVGNLNPVTGKVTIYALPSANLPDSAGKPLPYGLHIDAKDRLWATQMAGNTLVRFDTRNIEMKLYKMPEAISGPRRSDIGVDGSIWIPEFDTGYLTRFDPDTETFERFNLGNSAIGPYAAAVDPRGGAVWITGSLDSSLLRFDTKTHAVERYPLPTEPAYTRHVVVDAKTGAVWSAYSSLPTAIPKIVRLDRRD